MKKSKIFALFLSICLILSNSSAILNVNSANIPVDFKNIAIKPLGKDLFVSSENGMKSMSVNKSSIGITEKFNIEYKSADTVAIKSLSNDRYVCAESKGAYPLIANRKAIGLWETYKIFYVSQSKIALKSLANNKYVSYNSRTSKLIASSSTINELSTFEIVASTTPIVKPSPTPIVKSSPTPIVKPTSQTQNVLIVYITSNDPSPYNSPFSTIEEIKAELMTGDLNANKQLQLATYDKFNFNLGGVEYIKYNTSTKDQTVYEAYSPASVKLAELGYKTIKVGKFTKLRRPASHVNGTLDFDHVMFFVPRNTKYSNPSSDMYGNASKYPQGVATMWVLIHEMGHNMGLGHSGDPTDDYSDFTDFMGNTSTHPNGLNAPKKLQAGIFDSYLGSHIKENVGGSYKIYPIAEKPKIVGNNRYELKVVEIPVTNTAYLEQVAKSKSKTGIIYSNYHISYTISYVKNYDISNVVNPSTYLADLAKYTYTKGRERTIFIHKQEQFFYNNGDLYDRNFSAMMGEIDAKNPIFTIKEGGSEFQIKLDKLSPDSSFGNDYAEVTVERIK